MPAKSAKQQRFMAAVANNPKFAKKVGVSQNVGEEFMMKRGGMAKSSYKYGGKVRGCGAVSKKMRPTKMVKMKGS
jgi:hypothetical protein